MWAPIAAARGHIILALDVCPVFLERKTYVVAAMMMPMMIMRLLGHSFLAWEGRGLPLTLDVFSIQGVVLCTSAI